MFVVVFLLVGCCLSVGFVYVYLVLLFDCLLIGCVYVLVLSMVCLCWDGVTAINQFDWPVADLGFGCLVSYVSNSVDCFNLCLILVVMVGCLLFVLQFDFMFQLFSVVIVFVILV